jgi:hypothetical protein
MLVDSIPTTAPWSVVARAVFWSRDVELPTWREMCLRGHASYLPDSISRMSTKNFLRFLGRDNFVKNWPTMRTSPSVAHLQFKGVPRLDVAWSYLATGTANMPAEAALAKFPGRSREVYDQVVRHQGTSIYKIARLSGIPYRRVHAHVTRIIACGLIKTRQDEGGPRRHRLHTMR